MKKIMLLMAVTAFSFGAIQAQDIPERKRDESKKEGRHGSRHDKGMKDLNLSEDQKAQFKALNQDYRKQMETLRKQDDITVKESREKMAAIRKDHRTKMQGLLTTEQQEKMKKSRAERGTKMKEKGKARMEKMKADLNLTADQSAKMDANREAMKTKMKAIHENPSLTAEEKKAQTKELMKAQKESFRTILTEEQIKKLEENKGKRKHQDRKKSA